MEHQNKKRKLNNDQEIIKNITTNYKNKFSVFCIDIITNKQIIKFNIDINNYCCEEFDVLFLTDTTNTTLSHFKDAKITDITLDSKDLLNTLNYNLISVGDTGDQELLNLNDQNDGNTLNLKITTNKGILGIVVYNIHNGYYRHNVKLEYKWKDTMINDTFEI